MASIFNCWTCDVRLDERPDGCFFWCSDEHRDAYEAKIQASLKAGMESDPDGEPTKPFVQTRKQDEVETPKLAKGKGRKSKSTSSKTKKPKLKRRRIRQISANENAGTTRKYICKLCGESGHNARTCKNL